MEQIETALPEGAPPILAPASPQQVSPSQFIDLLQDQLIAKYSKFIGHVNPMTKSSMLAAYRRALEDVRKLLESEEMRRELAMREEKLTEGRTDDGETI